MYLIFRESEFDFSINISDVLRIVEINSIVSKNGKYFLGEREVQKIDFQELMQIKYKKHTKKSKVLLLNSEKDKIPAFFVDDVGGFVKDDVNIYKKQDFLDRYGFFCVKGFFIKEDKLFFIIDAKALLKKLEKGCE